MRLVKNTKGLAWDPGKISKEALDSSKVPEFIIDEKWVWVRCLNSIMLSSGDLKGMQGYMPNTLYAGCVLITSRACNAHYMGVNPCLMMG